MVRRIGRGLRRIGAVLVLLTAVGLLLYLLVLPGVVENAIRDALADQGFTDADFVLESLSPTGIHLADFTLSADRRLTVDAIDVDYTISSLRDGRVQEVRLTGVRFEIGLTDGELDLGPLADLPAGGEGGAAEIPIDRILFRRSALVVRAGDRTHHLPLDGEIDIVARDRFRARLETRLFELPLGVEAEVRPDAGLIEGKALLGVGDEDEGAILEWNIADLGGGDERIRIRIDAAKRRFEVPGDGPQLSVDGFRIAGIVEIHGRDRIAEIDLDGWADHVAHPDFAIEEPEFELVGGEDHIRVKASAFKEDLHVELSTAALPASIAEITSEDLALPSSFTVSGVLPALLRDAVDRAGITLHAHAAGRLDGRAVVRPADLRVTNLEAALSLSAPRLVAHAAGILVEALSGEAEIEGEIGMDRLDLEVLPGAAFRAETVRVPAATVTPVSLDVKLEERTRFSLDLGKTTTWKAYAPSLVVDLTAPDEGIEFGGFTLRGAKATGRMAVDASPERIRVALVDGLLASIPAVEGPAGHAGPLNLLVRNGSRGDVAYLDLRNGSMRAAGTVRTVSPFDAELSGLTAKVRSVTVAAEIEMSADASATVSGRLTLEVSRARHDDMEIVLEDVAASLPFALSGGEDEDLGTIAVRSVIFRGHRLPAITGRVRRVGSEVSLTAAWPLTPTALLAIEGETDLASPRPSASLEFSTPRFSIARGDLLDEVIHAESGFHLVGDLSANGSLEFANGRMEPSVTVSVDEAVVTGDDGDLSIEGIRAAVELTALAPPRTAGGQRVSFRTGKIGDLEIGDGQVLFRIEGPRSILVESARWRLGSTGRFLAHSFRVDPEEPDVDLDLFLEDLALSDWLSLVTAEHASGEGRLYGRLPIRIRTKPRLSVTLGAGFLYALGGGTLRIPDAELVDRMLQENVPELDGDIDYGKLVRQRIVASLKDFEFSVLRFDIHRKTGGLTLSVTANGRGRKVDQELNLTVNFNGFDALIAPALGMKLGIEHAREEMEKRFRKQ